MVIRTEGITKVTESKNILEILHGIDLSENKGNFISMLGPSGSGEIAL